MKTFKDLLKEMNSGKIFTAHFLKKDNKTKEFTIPRTMTARTGVKKGNKGKGLSFDPMAKGLLPVLDMDLSKTEKDINNAKRFVNLNTLIWVQISGVKYWISDLIIDESIKEIKELNKIILK
jgi:hypothetical protein